MTAADVKTIIDSLVPLVTAIGVVVGIVMTYRKASAAERAGVASIAKVAEVGVAVDGVVSKLLDAKDEATIAKVDAAHATGKAEGIAETNGHPA